ncbi:hypothetical protein PV392_05965 [Streptomyces sp. ME03-5709C]|nr:hypothetical protein [Streptomyces sp. ME03-5709C]
MSGSVWTQARCSPYASDLNPVEGIWPSLRRTLLRARRGCPGIPLERQQVVNGRSA